MAHDRLDASHQSIVMKENERDKALPIESRQPNGELNMWVCLKNSFLSIVSKDCRPDELMVRARRPGDIEKVFPDAKVTRNTGSDYLYRAVVPRDVVLTLFMALLSFRGISTPSLLAQGERAGYVAGLEIK